MTRRTDEGRLLLLVGVVMLLAVAIPALFLAGSEGKMSLNLALVYGLVLWSTWRLVLAAAHSQRRLTLMCFYVFVYVFFGVQPMQSIWTNTFPIQPFLTAAEITVTIGIIALGIAAFEAAYVSRRVRRRPSAPPAPDAIRARPVTLFAFWLGIVAATGLVAAAMLHYGAAIFLGIRGGGLLVSTSEGPNLSQVEWLLVIYGLRVLMATLLFMAVYLWKTRKRHDWPGRSMWTLRGSLIVLALVNMVVSNPLSAARLWSGSVILTVLFISAPWRGSRSYLLWSSGAILGLLLVFAGIDPRRIVNTAIVSGEPVTVGTTIKVMSASVENIQSDANFDAFQMVGLTRNYSDQFGYSFGRQLLLPAFFWVPRSVWPGKPIGIGDMVGESLNLWSVNVSAPMWAEGYANLGLAGVVILLAVFGRLARIADDYLVRTTTEIGEVLPTVSSAFFAANTLILLRGDLTTGTMFLQMVVGFTFGMMLLSRRRTRSGAASPTAPALSRA